MRPTLRHRVVACITALLGSLSAPALALAHGHVHEHLAHAHAAASHGDDHDSHEAPAAAEIDLPAVESDAGSAYRHGHPGVMVASVPREQGRSPILLPIAAIPTPAVVMLTTVREIVTPVPSGRALLARPEPGSGPPPTLRAPPQV